VYGHPGFGLTSAPPLHAIEEVSAPDSRTLLIRWKAPYADAASLSTRDRDAALALLAAANGLNVDYVEVADFDPPTLAGAVRVGSTRLIDNVPLEGEE